MAYTKQDAAPVAAAAVEHALAQNGLAPDLIAQVAPALVAAGAVVALDTGVPAWVSCIVHDRPETPQVDLLTVAVAYRDGAPWAKPNGQLVAVVFWHGLFPDALAALTVSTARRALTMLALGEPQPQVPVDAPEGTTLRDAVPLPDAASRSIRTAITAAQEIDAPLEDVL